VRVGKVLVRPSCPSAGTGGKKAAPASEASTLRRPMPRSAIKSPAGQQRAPCQECRKPEFEAEAAQQQQVEARTGGHSAKSRRRRTATGVSSSGSNMPSEPTHQAIAGSRANGAKSSAPNRRCDARSPKVTANVRLPTSLSCTTSRWLLTTRAAAARQPMATAARALTAPTLPVSTQSVPSTATSPKKMNTVNSPKGVYAIGRGPPM
jgi:hypothetical protein